MTRPNRVPADGILGYEEAPVKSISSAWSYDTFYKNDPPAIFVDVTTGETVSSPSDQPPFRYGFINTNNPFGISKKASMPQQIQEQVKYYVDGLCLASGLDTLQNSIITGTLPLTPYTIRCLVNSHVVLTNPTNDLNFSTNYFQVTLFDALFMFVSINRTTKT